MKAILRFYRVLNLLSLDVAAGATVCAAFFARVFHVQVRLSGLASLGIAVWIIYTIDHLLDVRRLKKAASTKRHQFHQRNFRTISGWVLVALAIDLVMVFYIRKPVFIWGISLTGAIGLYLLFQRFLNPFKELVGALLYSFGVLLPVLSLHTGILPKLSALLIAGFVLTALINMILFSWFDLEHDLKDTQLSVVTYFGKRNSGTLLKTLFVLQLALLVTLLWQSTFETESLILFGMNVVLLLLFLFSKSFAGQDEFRLAGDLIFIFPLPYLFLHV